MYCTTNLATLATSPSKVHLVDVPVSSHRPFFNLVSRSVHVRNAHSLYYRMRLLR